MHFVETLSHNDVIILFLSRLSNTVDLMDVEEADRLHKEALKQSATDPMSGKIDVSTIYTGQSEGSRKRREELKKVLKDIVSKKGKAQTMNFSKTWQELREQSDLVRRSKDFFSISVSS